MPSVVQLRVAARVSPSFSREVKRRVRAMIRALKLEGVEVSVSLTGDAQMRTLNRRWRGKDKTTDVLAFPLGDELLGDIVISVPTARAQAAARGHTVLAEVTMLLAHGLLHLRGWDHRTDAEDARMTREAERLCVAAAPQRRQK